MPSNPDPHTTRILTWNVLHRVHAVNWGEEPASGFPDEARRVDAIAEAVLRLGAGCDAICLQEVSGDQLQRLRARVPAGASLFDHLHPRLPRLRRADPAGVVDAREHLVTIVFARGARSVRTAAFASDPGKGLLAVELPDGTVAINTHVSARERGSAQLALLAGVLHAFPYAFVAGDFNASVAVVAAALGEGAVLTDLSTEPPSRTGSGGKPGHTIDHVAVVGGAILRAAVLDGAGLSDHRPVLAEIAFGRGG